LLTGERAVVYVEVEGTDRPTFEGREVVLGPRAGDYYVVVSGLAPGERVVTNGAFKIDSAMEIRAMPSMMSPPDERVSGQAAGAHAGRPH
ncbi:MAG: efflux transporter periplasmic adaptor subunit, partial [Candidatus Eisenbacteria bacterium]|nr:efflux transporter periplasmic adaptor subunit [Candidatus Eisenbacteria bacterium]